MVLVPDSAPLPPAQPIPVPWQQADGLITGSWLPPFAPACELPPPLASDLTPGVTNADALAPVEAPDQPVCWLDLDAAAIDPLTGIGEAQPLAPPFTDDPWQNPSFTSAWQDFPVSFPTDPLPGTVLETRDDPTAWPGLMTMDGVGAGDGALHPTQPVYRLLSDSVDGGPWPMDAGHGKSSAMNSPSGSLVPPLQHLEMLPIELSDPAVTCNFLPSPSQPGSGIYAGIRYGSYLEFLERNPQWLEDHGATGPQAQVITPSSRFPWLLLSTPGAARAFDAWCDLTQPIQTQPIQPSVDPPSDPIPVPAESPSAISLPQVQLAPLAPLALASPQIPAEPAAAPEALNLPAAEPMAVVISLIPAGPTAEPAAAPAAEPAPPAPVGESDLLLARRRRDGLPDGLALLPVG